MPTRTAAPAAPAAPEIGSFGMASMGLSALSGVMSGINSIIQGKAYEKAAKRARAQGEKNAQILEQLARISYVQERKDGAGILSAQQAYAGKANITAGTGSHLDLMSDTRMQVEVAALRRKYGYDSKAYQARVSGISAGFQADVAAWTANAQAGQQIVGGLQRAATTGAYLERPKLAENERTMFSDDTGEPLLESTGTGFEELGVLSEHEAGQYKSVMPPP